MYKVQDVRVGEKKLVMMEGKIEDVRVMSTKEDGLK